MSGPGRRGVHPIVRNGYVLRVLGCTIALLILIAIFHANPPPLAVQVVLLAQALLWPHAAFLIARRHPEPKRAERRSLLVDCFVCGAWMALASLPLLASTAGVCIFGIATMAYGGLPLLLRGAVAMALGAAAYAGLFGFAFVPDSSIAVSLISIGALLALGSLISYYAHEGNRELVRLKRMFEQKSQELERLRERYELATHSARSGVFVWHVAEGRIEFDESLRKLYGMPEGKTEETWTNYVQMVHPDDRPQRGATLKALMARSTRKAPDEYFDEYRLVRPSGEAIGIHIRGTVFWSEDGEPARLMGVACDATQLMSAQRELERANQELDDFSYLASHDLKEPLRGIQNYAQFLLEDHADKLNADGRSMLHAVSAQALRMQRLIEELLHVAKLGKLKVEEQEVDLNALVGEVTESLDATLKEKQVAVRIPRPLPSVRCDRVRVGEVFRNLITNAYKYSDKPDKWIEIGHNGAGPAPTLYVKDNGIGIRPEHQGRVFQLFKRLHSRDAYGGGTGAGLTIARKIVESHGGKIWLESEPDQGTTFHFTLQA